MAGKSLADLIVKLGLDSKQFVTGMQKAAKAGDKLDKATEKNNARLKMMKIQVAAVTAAMAAMAVVTFKMVGAFKDAAVEMENITVRYRFLLGSQKEANRMFAETKGYARSVAFEYRDLAASAATLSGVMKGGVDEVRKWMPIVTDLATVSGLPIQETTSQIIRMYSAGAAAADMFRERGITAMMGFRVGAIYSVEETRKKILEEWSRVGSKFGGASAAMADTWQGIMSMIKDEWMFFKMEVMDKGAFEAFKKLLKSILDMIRDFKESGTLDTLGRSFSDILSSWAGWLETIVGWLKDAHDFWTRMFGGAQTERDVQTEKLQAFDKELAILEVKLRNANKEQKEWNRVIKQFNDLNKDIPKASYDAWVANTLRILDIESRIMEIKAGQKNVSASLNALNKEEADVIEKQAKAYEYTEMSLKSLLDLADDESMNNFIDLMEAISRLGDSSAGGDPFKYTEMSLKSLLDLADDPRLLALSGVMEVSQEHQNELAEKRKEAAQEQYEEYQKFLSSIQTTTSSMFYDMFTGTLNSWEDFTDRMKNIFLRMLADIAAQQFVTNIVANIIPQGAFSSLAGTLGTGAAGAAGAVGAGQFGARINPITGAMVGGAGGGLAAAGGAATGIGIAAFAGMGVMKMLTKKKKKWLGVSGSAGFTSGGGFQYEGVPAQVRGVIDDLSSQTLGIINSIPLGIYSSVVTGLESQRLSLEFGEKGSSWAALAKRFGQVISERWNRSMNTILKTSYKFAISRIQGLESGDALEKITGLLDLGKVSEAGSLFNSITNFVDSLQSTIDKNTLDKTSISIKNITNSYRDQIVQAEKLGVSLDLVNEAFRSEIRGTLMPVGDITQQGFQGALGVLPTIEADIINMSDDVLNLFMKTGEMIQPLQDAKEKSEKMQSEWDALGLYMDLQLAAGPAKHGGRISDEFKNFIEELGVQIVDFWTWHLIVISQFENAFSEWQTTNIVIPETEYNAMMAEIEVLAPVIIESINTTAGVLSEFVDNFGDLFLTDSVKNFRTILGQLDGAMDVLSTMSFSPDLIAILEEFSGMDIVDMDWEAITPYVSDYRDYILKQFFQPLQDIVDEDLFSNQELQLRALDEWYKQQKLAIEAIGQYLGREEWLDAMSLLDEAFALQSQSIIDNYINPIDDAFQQFLTGILDLVPVQSAEMYGQAYQSLYEQAATGDPEAFQNLLNFTSGQFLPFMKGYASSDLSYGYQDVFTGTMQGLQQLTLNIDGQEFASIIVDLAASNPELALALGGQ